VTGSLAEPIVEAPVIVEAAQGPSGGILLPLILPVLVADAVAGDRYGAGTERG